MMNNKQRITGVFLLLGFNAILVFLNKFQREFEINYTFLLAVNLMLFTMFIITLIRTNKAKNNSPQQMVQSVMMGSLLKLVVFAGAALFYAMRKNATAVGTPTLMIAMIMYIVYTYFEVKDALKK